MAEQAASPGRAGRIRIRRGLIRILALAGLAALALGACARDRAADEDHISLEERAAFTAPADSSLAVEQVDHYLRATLAQLELIGEEAATVRDSLARLRMARREAARSGAPRPRAPAAIWSDFLDAAYIRGSRRMGYNPAELWFVRQRVAMVGGHLMAQQAHAGKDQAAALFRQQAELLRSQPGVPAEQVDAMLRAAEEAERQPPPPSPPRLLQNLEALRRARSTLGDSAWVRLAGVAAGGEITALGELPETEMTVRLDSLQQVFRFAVESQ